MAELREFQKASSARIIEYYREDNNHRYLLADEVGLGKTIIAADVINEFVTANKQKGKATAVYYVCGNLALISQNEKKLRDGFEDYSAYQCKESRHEDMSRLGLSFVKQNYLNDYNQLIALLKAVAVWMLMTEGYEYSKESFYGKKGKTLQKRFVNKLALIKKLFNQYYSVFNVYQNKLKDVKEVYFLLLELYEKLKGKKPGDDVEGIVQEVNSYLEQYEYIDNEEKYKKLSNEGKELHHEMECRLLAELAKLVYVYDELVKTKKISFQSLTPRTSIEKSNSGTWIERVAAGIVFYKWKEANCKEVVQIFEEELNTIIEGVIKGFENVLFVMKNGKYKFATKAEEMTMFLYGNITKADVAEIMKGMDIPEESKQTKKYARAFLKEIMNRMAVYSLQKNKENKEILVVVDEFQNFSKILGTEKSSEECTRVRDELLHNKAEHYILLLSATPFHFSNANVQKDYIFQSRLKQVNSEVDLILKYVMGEEVYEKWLETTDNKYQYLYSEGISRTERKEGRITQGNMTMSYEEDFELLKEDIENIIQFSNFETARELENNDRLIYYGEEVYVYRNDRFYFAPSEAVDWIMSNYVEWEEEEQEALFYECSIEEDDECAFEPEYVLVEKPGDLEKKILNRLKSQTLPVSYIKDTPWILSFAQDYKLKVTSKTEDYVLDYEKVINYEEIETKHARFRKLQETLLKEREAYKLLYIPPSKPDYKLWGVYENYDNAGECPAYYSKALIFSKNYHTPRAFSAMLSYESERLNHMSSLNPNSEYKKRVRYDLSGNEWKEYESEKINVRLIKEEIEKYQRLQNESKTRKPYMDCINKDRIERDKDMFCLGSIAGFFLDMVEISEDLNCRILIKLLSSIYSVFLTREAHGIINTMAGETYMDKIHAYSAQGNLRSVLNEYVHLILEEEHISKNDKGFLEVLEDKYFSVIREYMNGNQFKIKAHVADGRDIDIYTGFAQGITGEEGKTDSQRALKNKIICFNSPFRPFVFTTTSVGAEGLDFHWFCKNIYHWALEMNPEKFQQKEGRINRFHCHSVRLNLGRDYPEKSWGEIYKSVEKKEDNPFWPEWCYDGNGENTPYASLSRNTCYYPGSYEDYAYGEMLENMEIYREIIDGQHLSPYYK